MSALASSSSGIVAPSPSTSAASDAAYTRWVARAWSRWSRKAAAAAARLGGLGVGAVGITRPTAVLLLLGFTAANAST